MKNNASRDKILNKIGQKDRQDKSVLLSDFSIFNNEEIFYPIDNIVETFKTELEALSGKCFVSENKTEQFNQLKRYLEKSGHSFVFCREPKIISKLDEFQICNTHDVNHFDSMSAGITSAEFLVARTGSVVVSSATKSGRQMHVFPPVHLVIASVTQLVDFPSDAIIALQKKYGNNLPTSVSFITGPSRTADIEKTLVLGAHGPKEFVVFLCLQ